MVRTVFIAGNGRSGSTILHNILGQIDGFAAVGELRYIWGRAAIDNQLCGCGERFRECPFWNKVMTHAFGGLDLAYARQMYDWIESFRLHNLPLMVTPATRFRELARLAEYREGIARLYAAIHEVSGCRVIVDSSKNPSYGYLLRHVRGVEPHYLHVVRDVPAVAYSWGKQQDFEPGCRWPASRRPRARCNGSRGTPRPRSSSGGPRRPGMRCAMRTSCPVRAIICRRSCSGSMSPATLHRSRRRTTSTSIGTTTQCSVIGRASGQDRYGSAQTSSGAGICPPMLDGRSRRWRGR